MTATIEDRTWDYKGRRLRTAKLLRGVWVNQYHPISRQELGFAYLKAGTLVWADETADFLVLPDSPDSFMGRYCHAVRTGEKLIRVQFADGTTATEDPRRRSLGRGRGRRG